MGCEQPMKYLIVFTIASQLGNLRHKEYSYPITPIRTQIPGWNRIEIALTTILLVEWSGYLPVNMLQHVST